MKTKIGLLIVAIIIAFIINTLYQAGSFSTIENYSQLTNVSSYDNVSGTEDLAIDTTKGLLFISSTDRWKFKNKQKAEDGIYILNINSNAKPVKLATTYQDEFHPHGISLLQKDGSDYLFVVNHNQQGNFIELFKFENNVLTHLRSFSSEQMCCPNDLVAVDIDKFYVTNDHGTEKGFMRLIEDYLRVPRSSVLYFDGSNYTKVFDNLNYANGIEVSPDGKTVYVTETTGRKISVLAREIQSGQLKLQFRKELETGLDNITIDAEGNLWIAAHPKLLDFVGHAKDPNKHSPSQVIKLTPKDNNDFQVEQIFIDSGEKISGSSTALYFSNTVYIGVVYENKLLKGSYLQSGQP